MKNHEDCGLCGSKEGVRFPVPGTQVDAVLCAGCVNSAVTAHAEHGSARWAAARRATHGAHTSNAHKGKP
jgi:hypothetical protein